MAGGIKEDTDVASRVQTTKCIKFQLYFQNGYMCIHQLVFLYNFAVEQEQYETHNELKPKQQVFFLQTKILC